MKYQNELFKVLRYNIPLRYDDIKEYLNEENESLWSETKFDGNREFYPLEYAIHRGNLGLIDLLYEYDQNLLLGKDKNNEFQLLSLFEISAPEHYLEKYLSFINKMMNPFYIKKIIEKNLKNCLEVLKKNNIDLPYPHEHAETPFFDAVQNYNINYNFLKELAKEYDPNKLNKYRQNFLFYLKKDLYFNDLRAFFNETSLIDFLKEYNINVNQQDINGDYPLLLCAEALELHNIELLLELGADPFLKNKDNSSFINYVPEITNKVGNQEKDFKCIRKALHKIKQRKNFIKNLKN